ncbi:hypothetical protein KGF51_09805 [Clostridioides sp. ZZV14-6045]|nr:hypothetical protein [Clostridioides sp. ZZV14-6045]
MYKNLPTKIKLLINMVIIGLMIFIWGIVDNEYRSVLTEQEEKSKKCKLDYRLEDEVIKTIESNNVVDFRKLAKVNFSKISVCSSYDTLGDFEGGISYANDRAPKNNFSYILFLDENEEVVKAMVLNKKYDISVDRSYREYLSENVTFKFNKVDKENEVTYRLEE